MSDGEQDNETPNSAELHPKRTTSFAAAIKKKPPEQDLATRIAREREKTKYWARILLLFPLVPVCLALTTIVFGGVVINVATNNCNADLMRFMQGAVVLSHVLVLFYTYCWMGPWPIKSLRTVRVFYLVYGLLCVVWWGLYGTLQAATATSSGFESCLAMSPALYIISQYEVASFWVVFVAAVCFVVSETTRRMRQTQMDQWAKKKDEAKRAREQAQQESRDQVLQDAQEEARRLEDEQRQKLAAEREKLFDGSDDDDENQEQEEADGEQEYGADEERPEEEDEGEGEDVVPLESAG